MPAAIDVATNYAISAIVGGAGGAGTPLNPSDTSLVLTGGTGALFAHPGARQFTRVMLGSVGGPNEIAKITGTSTDTLTLIRCNNFSSSDPDFNATAGTWPDGTVVQEVFTAGSLWDLTNTINAGRVFNIMDYGAVGDGVTDSTAAITAALTAAATPLIANPSAGPTVIQQAGGTFALNAVVNVAFTWLHYLGETLPSPTTQITISTVNNEIKVTVPAFPPGVFGANVYMSSVSGGTSLFKGEAVTTSSQIPSITASGGNKIYTTFAATTDAITNPAAPTINDTNHGTVLVPAGWFISGPQQAYSHVNIVGEGMGTSVITLKANSNADLFSAFVGNINPATALAHGSPHAIADFTIRDITLDGNMWNQTAGPSFVLDIYANGYTLMNLEVMNGFSGGIRADYSGPMPWAWNGQGGSPASINQRKVETDWINVHVHTSINGAGFNPIAGQNGIGVQFYGPHDSRWVDVISFDHNSHSIYLGPNSDGLQCFGCHAYSPGANDSTASSWVNEGIALYAASCEAEGANNEQLVMLAGRCNWVGGSIYSSSSLANAAGLQIGQAAGLLPLVGTVNKTLQSAPAAPSLTTSTTGGSIAATTVVNLVMTWVQVISGTVVGETLASAQAGITTGAGSTNSVGVTVPAVPAWATGANIYVANVGGGSTYYKAFSNVGAGVTTVTALGNNANPQPPGTGSAYATNAVSVSDYQFMTRIEQVKGPNGGINFANDGGFGLIFAGMLAATVSDKIYVGTPNASTALYLTADGYTNDTRQQIQLGKGIQAWGQSATAPATATSGTIATGTDLVSRVSPAGAVTGVIMAAGTYPGQPCVVINEAVAANSITMAAAGTSHVADGISCVIPGLTQKMFMWDTSTSLWYHN